MNELPRILKSPKPRTTEGPLDENIDLGSPAINLTLKLAERLINAVEDIADSLSVISLYTEKKGIYEGLFTDNDLDEGGKK